MQIWSKKIALKVLTGFLILTVGAGSLVALTPSYAKEGQTPEKLEKKIEALKERSQLLEQRSQQYRKNILERQGQINSLENTIAILRTQIAKLENDLELTNSRIEATSLELERLSLRIKSTQERIKKNRTQISRLLRLMYEQDNVSLIEVLFKGQSLSEFFSQKIYREEIGDKLNLSFVELKALQDLLGEEKTQQQQARMELVELKVTLESQRSALEDQSREQNRLLSSTKGEEQRFQKLLSQVEQEFAGIMQELIELTEEARRMKAFQLYLKAGKIPPPGTKIFLNPLKNSLLTQGYGMTSFARRKAYGGNIHNGIDISTGVIGSEVRAAASGKVIGRSSSTCPNYRSRRCEGGWGNWVAIEHEGGIVTLYAHLMAPAVASLGQSVEAGQLIGHMGSSGNSTGPHLHFSVYTEFFLLPGGYPGYPGTTLNPNDYL